MPIFPASLGECALAGVDLQGVAGPDTVASAAFWGEVPGRFCAGPLCFIIRLPHWRGWVTSSEAQGPLDPVTLT